MRNDCSGGHDQSLVEFGTRKVLGLRFGLKRLGRPRAPASDRCASPWDFEGHIPSMLLHPMIPMDLPPSITFSGSVMRLARRRTQDAGRLRFRSPCDSCPAFNPFAGSDFGRCCLDSRSRRSMHIAGRSCLDLPDQMHIVSQLAHLLVLSSAAFNDAWRRSGIRTWCCGASRMDSPADLKTMAAALPDCRLITVPGIGHSMNLESPARYAGYLAHGSAGFPEMKSRSSLALKVHLRQPHPVQQHDLPLGLAEEAEDTHAVKM